MIEQYLKKINLNDKEIDVYLTVIKYGKISATDISKITKINRTTVYSVLKELLKKKIIQEDLGNNKIYFFASPLIDLNNLYKEDEKKLLEKKHTIQSLINQLNLLPKSTKYSIPKIRFIDEKELKNFIFKQLPVWIESTKNKKDKNWWGFQDVSFIENYKEWFEYHWEIYPKNFGAYLITNKKPAETKLSKNINNRNRQIKYWNESLNFSATHAVLGDYVVFIVTNQRPHYMIETFDEVMAENLRELFKGIWKKLK